MDEIIPLEDKRRQTIKKAEIRLKATLKDDAKQIKETMDKRFGATWHCIIGQNYGFEVTHEQENLLYLFYLVF